MLKLIALYISLDGDMNELYDYMIKRSFILEKLSKNLLISKIIIIRNESSINGNKKLKDNILKNKEENENIDKGIFTCKKYLENMLRIRDYFDSRLDKINLEKIITRQTLNLEKIKLNQILTSSGN